MKRVLSLCATVSTVMAISVVAPQSVVASSIASPFDSTFGTNGQAVAAFPQQRSDSAAIDILSDIDGNLLVHYMADAGRDGVVVTIGKYTANGAPITQFGTNGRSIPVPVFGSRFALQLDGKILIAGFEYTDNGTSLIVYRLTSSGILDTTFGTKGILKIPSFPGKSFESSEVHIAVNQSSGRIHLGFSVDSANIPNPNLYFIAVTPEGAIDLNWGRNGGREVIPPTSPTVSAFSSLNSLQVLSDGSLLGIGTTFAFGRHILLTKINPSGYLDIAFDGAGFDLNGDGTPEPGNGNVVIQFATETNAFMTASLLMQNDDLVMVGMVGAYGGGPQNFGVAKIRADGTADTSFDSDGFKVTTQLVENDLYSPRRIVQLPSGAFAFPVNSSTSAGYLKIGATGTITDPASLWTGSNTGAVATSIAVQSSGAVVVTGQKDATKDSIVRRFDSSGSEDGTFASIDLELKYETWDSYILSSTPMPDGSIITTGGASVSRGPDQITRAVIYKFTSSGQPDSSYGLGGYQILSPPSDQYWIYVVGSAVQSDGKVIVLGAGRLNNSNDASILMWRLNTDGSPDSSFGNNGLVETSVAGQDLSPNSIAVDSNGKITVTLTSFVNYEGTPWIYRYTSNGQPDPSFTDASNVVGGVSLSFGGGAFYMNASFVAPNGLIYIAGLRNLNNAETVVIARLLPNGSLDSNFSNGFVTWPRQQANMPGRIRQISLDGQSRVLLIGMTDSDSQSIVMARLTADGTIDNTFNTTGSRVFDFTDPQNIDFQESNDVVETSDGYLIVGGGDTNPEEIQNDLFSGMALLTTNGAPVNSFGTNGILKLFENERILLGDIAPLPDGSHIVSAVTQIGMSYKSLLLKIPAPQPSPPPAPKPDNPSPAPQTPPPVVNAESEDIKLVVSVSQAAILKRLKWTPAKGSKITMTIAKSSRKVCRISKTRVLAIDTGTCRVTVTSTLKKKATKKTLSFKVS